MSSPVLILGYKVQYLLVAAQDPYLVPEAGLLSGPDPHTLVPASTDQTLTPDTDTGHCSIVSTNVALSIRQP